MGEAVNIYSIQSLKNVLKICIDLNKGICGGKYGQTNVDDAWGYFAFRADVRGTDYTYKGCKG